MNTFIRKFRQNNSKKITKSKTLLLTKKPKQKYGYFVFKNSELMKFF